MSSTDEIKKEIELLRKKIFEADRAYYVDANPIMSDLEYDRLFDRLLKLEEQYPEFNDTNSPTRRVGSDIDNTLPEREHTLPVLSLDKCYSTNDLMDWINKNSEKLNKKIEVIIEPKIDGAGVVLYYENGRLDRALTRGNGYFGNDITENIKTIGSVPLIIEDNIALAVRGEVFINNNDFIEFNEKYAGGKYSNPRNLASGAIRRIKSKESALFPLNVIIYEGFYQNIEIDTHLEILINLKQLGFPINDNLGYFSKQVDLKMNLPFKNFKIGNIDELPDYVIKLKNERKNFNYDIDGLVVKLNDLASREKLGFTQHHPRWAIAYKFEAPIAETKVISIDVQIGRGGRATPVANLVPVELSGSTISRATLHNQEYINSLGVNNDDLVTISKRGDVIPAVEEVIEKGNNISPYKIQDKCPGCGSTLVEDGAHLFCLNEECPLRLLETLKYFVSRDQMDIETLGDKTIEFLFNKGLIKIIPDIYNFNYDKLLEYEGYKEKKVNNIKNSIEKSKNKGFSTILSSLGLKDIGNRVAALLVEKFGNIDRIIETAKSKNIDDLIVIEGIGEKIANSVIEHFNNPKVLNMIESLKLAGLNFKQGRINNNKAGFLNGTRWVITGSFKNFKPREIAGELIEKNGGKVLDSVSSNTTHLLCGESPGSKLDKAAKLGIKIIDEDNFNKIIENKKI